MIDFKGFNINFNFKDFNDSKDYKGIPGFQRISWISKDFYDF